MSVAAMVCATLLMLPVQETKVPFGLPPADENPVMAQIAPEDCMFYLRWASSSSADSSAASSTEQLLSDPEFQQFMLWTIAQAKVAMTEEFDALPQGDRLINQLFDVVPRMLTNSGALYIEEFDPANELIKAAVVSEIGELDADVQAVLADVGAAWLSDFAQPEPWGDGVIYRIKLGAGAPDMALGMRSGVLLFTMGTDVADEVVRRMESPAPAWVNALEQSFAMERRAMLGWVDLSAVLSIVSSSVDPEAQQLLSLAGIDRLKSLSFAAGFDGGEFVSRSRLVHDGEAPAMLMPLAETGLSERSFEFVPAEAAFAAVASVDFAEFTEAWLNALTKLNPEEADEIRAVFAGEDASGAMSFQNIAASLGEAMAIYFAPDEGGFMGVSAVLQVRDAEALRKQEKLLVDRLRGVFESAEDEDDFWRDDDYRLAELEFEGETIHYIAANSFWSFSPVSMSWCLQDDRLIISLFPQNIKAILSRPADTPTLASRTEVKQVLQQKTSDVNAMMFIDSPQVLNSFGPYAQIMFMILRQEGGPEFDFDPSAIPSGHLLAKYWTPDVMTLQLADGEIRVESQQTMPGTDAAILGTAGALLGAFLDEFGISAGRMLSPRYAEEEDAHMNLRQIGLALHNYHDTYGRFPAAYSTSDEGEALLSWRVHILPFLDEIELYEQFHLDEPWDSPHNIKLIEEIPRVYRAPGSMKELGFTNYMSIRADNSIFPGDKGVRIGDILDGTSNTIMVAEASDAVAVEWTKPDDVELDPMKPMKSLVGLRKGGFFVGLADGSVTKFPEEAETEELFRWIGRNDGEPNQLNIWDQ